MRRKIRQPVKGGVAGVPLVMQLEALECGAACLTMVLAYYGRWVPLEQVRQDCGVSRDGSNMRNICRAAAHYGLEVHGYKRGVEALRAKGTFPCIIHWNFNHFVVLAGFRGGSAVINDPARGAVRISMDEFQRSYTGLCLDFAPGKDFVPGGRRPGLLDFARRQLKGNAPALAFAALAAAVSFLFGIISPAVSRLYYDRLLTGEDPGWLQPFLWGMAALAALEVLAAWIRTAFALKLNGKMAVGSSAAFMWKLLRLPVSFFAERLPGDMLQRLSANGAIANALVQSAAPLALQGLMSIGYLAVMLRCSPVMAAVGLSAMLLNLWAAKSLYRRRMNLSSVQLRDAASLSSATMAGISMAETIKAAGAEEDFFRRWGGLQASLNAQQVRFQQLNARLGLLPGIISGAANGLMLFLGVRMAMEGRFTLGLLAAFQALLALMMRPAAAFGRAGQLLQETRSRMERVQDVQQCPDDPRMRAQEPGTEGDYAKLRGAVEMRGVTFGYAPLGEPVLRGFSMKLQPGGRVAIVGASGCGKSTVAKLLTGLYQPWSGEILYDGRPLAEIPRCVFTGSVAMVDQNIVLFEDTIAGNIGLWDASIADFEIILAARDAGIHDDILLRPGGYRGRLLENGRDLSGGQRQQLEIARVLAQDPTVVVLDEATSALDARTEQEVMQAIRDRGITCVVVAHRLSTIRDCDEILVLDKGRIVESGTHQALMALHGVYAQLVANG